MSRTIVRWSGIGLVAGVLLFGLACLGIPPEPMKTPLSAGTSMLLFTATLLLMLALPGVYARQADVAGTLGLAGHLLLQAGLTLALFYAGTPLLYPALRTPPGNTPLGLALGIALLAGLLFSGIATIRARVFPRWAGIAMLVATGGFFFEFFVAELLPPVASQVGSAFFGLMVACALGWLGVSAWRNPSANLASGA